MIGCLYPRIAERAGDPAQLPIIQIMRMSADLKGSFRVYEAHNEDVASEIWASRSEREIN